MPARWSRREFQTVLLTAAAFLTVARTNAADPKKQPQIDFTRDVRPILSEHCFRCHGPDAGRRKGKLRLDTSDGARAIAGSGERAIVPGKPDESELIRRVNSDDPEERMPPPHTKKRLSPAQIAALKAWVEQGATYRTHWAFVPPVRPETPRVRETSWCRNPIDVFVLARLEAEGLKPAPDADKATLLRRLSLDLIGLPPTLAELDAFLNDDSPDAYEKVVDRLLASPHYGERIGRDWLDAARYADSDGFEKDKSRKVWAYRDWVVSALNNDMPYDRFVIAQIAGDLLPNASQDDIVATGFLRNSMINEEGGVDPEQFRMEAMFDRMDAIGKSILGLTIQCAQCHTHKYDPLTHTEYYRLFAFLNETHEANVPVYSPVEEMKRSEIFREIAAIEAKLKERTPDWREKMAAWEKTADRDRPVWQVIRPEVDDISNGGQKYLPMGDGSFLAQGYAPTHHRVKMTAKVDCKSIAAFRLELLTDPNLPLGGPGRAPNGTGALTEFEAEVAPGDRPDKTEKVEFVRASASVNPPEKPLDPIFDDRSGKKRVTGPIEFAVDGKVETAWGIDVGPGRSNQPREAVFVPKKPIETPNGAIVTIYLKQDHGGWNSDDNQSNNLGRVRLSIADSRGATANPIADPVPPAVRAILSIPIDKRSPRQIASVFSYWRTTVPEWSAENDRIEALWKEHPEGTSQLVLRSRDEPRGTHRLDRGDFLKPKEKVEPGVPSFLNPLPAGAPRDRLTFARWLVARDAPTSARAIVNRIWQHDFGVGLVSTAEDFGAQGEAPSHPELLDWLSVVFQEDGWSLKRLQRLIVTSSTYRQDARIRSELLDRDPSNRLLARGARFRIDAEAVRDSALAASGLLNEKVGGPSVFPNAPAFLFSPPASYGPKVWIEAKGPDRYRRALYTFRYRSVPYPMLQTFDAPNGDVSCVRRSRSNTPLQALTTLNEPIFNECARALAARTLREVAQDDDRARLDHAFRLCVGRGPSDRERDVLLGFLRRARERFSRENAKPDELLATDVAPKPPEGTNPARFASWTALARVLLNLDETVSRQ